MARDWTQVGASAVNSTADFAGGCMSALMGIGGRFKRAKYEKFIECFCAVLGDVMSQNGSIKSEEIQALKTFFLHNCNSPAFAHFSADELVEKAKEYATARFMGNEEKIMRAVSAIASSSGSGGEEGKMTILAALGLAFSDGECDQKEKGAITRWAAVLNVNLTALANECQLTLPSDISTAPRSQIQAPPVSPAASTPTPVQSSAPPPPPRSAPAGPPCLMCKGDPAKMPTCAFCKGTGLKR